MAAQGTWMLSHPQSARLAAESAANASEVRASCPGWDLEPLKPTVAQKRIIALLGRLLTISDQSPITCSAISCCQKQPEVLRWRRPP